MMVGANRPQVSHGSSDLSELFFCVTAYVLPDSVCGPRGDSRRR